MAKHSTPPTAKAAWRISIGSGALALFGAAGFVACVSDAPSTAASGSGTDDASTSSDAPIGSSDGSTGGPAVAKTGDLTLYVGHVAQVDGSGSTPSTAAFAWTIKSAPAGSTITTASLQNATQSKASFVPDIPGDYALQLIVTASGGSSSTATATVHAAPGKAFYVETRQGASTTATDLHYVETSGKNDVAVSCPFTKPTNNAATYAEVMSESSGTTWSEGAPGDDPVVAFGYVDTLADGGAVTYVAAGRGSSRCDGLHILGHIDTVSSGSFAGGIELSPSAARVAYLIGSQGGASRLATVGFDGSNKHNAFGPLAVNDAGVERGVSAYPTPRWIDETHLAWVEYAGNYGWRVMTSPDLANPGTPTVYMDCSADSTTFGLAQQPSMLEFAMLKDGSVLAAVSGASDASNGANLVVLRPDPTTHECQLVRQVTSVTDTASDFALSPDQTKVAYLEGSGSGNGYLCVASLDGSSPPVKISGAPDGGASESHGPHWAAGGAWLVWGASGTSLAAMGIDAPSSQNVVAISAAGGKLVPLAVPDASTTQDYAIGNSCSLAFTGSSRGSGLVMIGAFFSLIARRRRRLTSV